MLCKQRMIDTSRGDGRDEDNHIILKTCNKPCTEGNNLCCMHLKKDECGGNWLGLEGEGTPHRTKLINHTKPGGDMTTTNYGRTGQQHAISGEEDLDIGLGDHWHGWLNEIIQRQTSVHNFIAVQSDDEKSNAAKWFRSDECDPESLKITDNWDSLSQMYNEHKQRIRENEYWRWWCADVN